MKTISISEDNYLALEDRFDPDIKTHDDVISGMFGFIDLLIEQNARLKAQVRELEATKAKPGEDPS